MVSSPSHLLLGGQACPELFGELLKPTTILLYARTGAGKTTQIGVLAEHVFATSGKKTRLYTADAGGLDTLRPYIELGIIDVVEIGDISPWFFLNKTVKGNLYKGGKWVMDAADNAKVGMFAYESAHAIARLIQADMENRAGEGVMVGGDKNTSFSIADGTESLRIGSASGYGKYGIPQAEMMRAIRLSHRLPAEYVLWTAGVSKDEDDINTNKIIGPDVLGKALTGILPMEFNYTFRMDVLPTKDGKAAPRHVLYLGTHQDIATGNAVALGNMRRPLDAPKLDTYIIEPADIVKALEVVRFNAKEEAKNAIKKRLGDKLK